MYEKLHTLFTKYAVRDYINLSIHGYYIMLTQITIPTPYYEHDNVNNHKVMLFQAVSDRVLLEII